MCRAFEEYGMEVAKDIAAELILTDKFSIEEIARITKLPQESVQELAEKLKAN